MKKNLLFTAFILTANFIFAQQARIYVDNTATSTTPDGSTWLTAYTNLQDAFDEITSLGADTVEVWVRATSNLYIPTLDPFTFTSYYTIPATNKNIFVYGGFAGTETSLNQRPKNSLTILSGDGGVQGDYMDNSPSLISILDPTPLNNTKVIIDGFIFQDANYYGSGTVRGAIYNLRDFVTVNNCIFKNNRTIDRGAAISTNRAIVINNSIFENNTANLYGGAIDMNLSFQANCFILNSKFFNNVSLDGIGGAIKADYITNLYLVNSLFVNNTAQDGSAVQVYQSNISAINCTFVKSNGSVFSGASNNAHYIVNSIIYKSSSTNMYSGIGQLFIGNSLYDNGMMTGFTSSGTNYIADPLFKYYNDTLLEQSVFELQSCSPGINEGNNANINYFINLGAINGDIQGKERLNDSIVDIGAYEYFKDTLIANNDSLQLQASSIYWLQQSITTDTILIDSVHLYNCNSNQIVTSVPLAGFNGSFVPTVSGNYAIIFTYKSGCSDTTECKSITITPNTMGEEEISISSIFHVYPNPAQDYIIIEGLTTNSNYQIYDLTGKLVLSGVVKNHIETINVSTLINGVYFLKIDGDKIRKVIVNK